MTMISFNDLLDVNIVHILSYLRETELATVREVNKKIFSPSRVNDAIVALVSEVYNIPTSSPLKKGMIAAESIQKRPDYLYNKEIQCIITALGSQPLLSLKGFWISTNWLSNAKKYFDSIELPDVVETESNKPSIKKRTKIQRRRESDVMRPWCSMTADIVCEHGGLAISSSTSRSKRRAMNSRMWHFLRKFYPDGPEFHCSNTKECIICTEELAQAKAAMIDKKEAVKAERRLDLVPEALVALSARKSGVPMHCVTSRVAFYNELEQEQEGNEVDSAALVNQGDVFQQPLVPGLYNLLPRKWLKAWRHYIKDVSAPSLPHLDCTALICNTHNQLVIPPHVEEYLIGLRPSLLSGLGGYPGEVAEILSADEWDSLQDVFHGAGDYNVRMCLDGAGGVSWNIGVCMVCDPYTYHPLLGKPSREKSNRNGSRPAPGLIA